MRTQSRFAFSTFLFLALSTSALFHACLALAETYPTQIQLLSFGGTSPWNATETILIPQGDGTFASRQVKSALTGGCEDLLTRFQARPLEVMHQNGYISTEMLETLKTLGERIDPRQLLLVTAFFEVPAAEAGQYPKGRVLGGSGDPAKAQTTRISLGSLFAVRGQVLVTDADGKPKLEARKVPYELDAALPRGIKKPLDRTRIKYVIELGRALVEKKNDSQDEREPLGDLGLAMGPIITALESEFHALAQELKTDLPIDPKEVLVVGHFLDAEHTRRMTHALPLRPLDAGIQEALEADPRQTLQSYLDLPLPATRAQWKEYDNTVTFGSLAAFGSKYPATAVSRAARALSELTRGRAGGALTGSDALHFLTEYATLMRESYDYRLGTGASRAPIMIRDRGTPLAANRLLTFLKKYGFTLDQPEWSRVRDFMEKNITTNPEPDLFTEGWLDRDYFLNYQGGTKQFAQTLEVANLDAEAAQARPIEYLASVILSVHDHYGHQLQSLSPDRYRELLRLMNEQQRKSGQRSFVSLDSEEVFDQFPIVLESTDPQVQAQLEILGGTAKLAPFFGMEFKWNAQGASLQGRQGEGKIYEFRSAQIAVLARQYPTLAQGARRRLHPGVHALKLKLLQSTVE